MHRLHHYAKFWLFLVFIFAFAPTQRIAAQEPLTDLHLLAWAADGNFLIGATPGQVVTLPGGSTLRQQVLWRLDADGSAQEQLAVGFNPQLSPDSRFVTFTQLDTQGQLSSWAVDVETGRITVARRRLPIHPQSRGDRRPSRPGLSLAGWQEAGNFGQ